jgi:hypothetical protein
MVVTNTIRGVAPTPIITPAVTENNNLQWGSSNSNNLMIRIPVVPAISSGNEPSVAVKAEYSTPSYALNWADAAAKQYGMAQSPNTETPYPTIHVYTTQDSRLDLTNNDVDPHIYYVEVNFYSGDVQLVSNTGQWKNNGFSWYVLPKQTVRAEVIPPESATSYVIKSVSIITTHGYFGTGYVPVY